MKDFNKTLKDAMYHARLTRELSEEFLKVTSECLAANNATASIEDMDIRSKVMKPYLDNIDHVSYALDHFIKKANY